MMELILNAVWFVLSLALIVSWVRRKGDACPPQSRGLVLLGCLLVLLFPVISITDDLHSEQLAMEDASATSKRIQNADSGRIALQGVVVAPLSSPAAPVWHVFGTVTADHSAPSVSFFSLVRSERAPPSVA